MAQLQQNTLGEECQQSIFQLIYDRYAKYIYFLVKKELGSFYDGQFVETAVQEIFTRIFYNIEKIDGIDSNKTKGYIYAVTRSVIANIRNKEYKEREKAKLITERFGYTDKKDVTIMQLMRKEVTFMLEEMIEHLPSQEKELVSLKYIKGKSNCEIAAELGISYENVGVRLFRVKKKLERVIKGRKEELLDVF